MSTSRVSCAEVAAVLPIMQKQKQGVDGARERIICGSSTGPKSGDRASMETIDERALTNQAPLPNQRECGGRLEAGPLSQPRCQRMIAEGAQCIADTKV